MADLVTVQPYRVKPGFGGFPGRFGWDFFLVQCRGGGLSPAGRVFVTRIIRNIKYATIKLIRWYIDRQNNHYWMCINIIEVFTWFLNQCWSIKLECSTWATFAALFFHSGVSPLISLLSSNKVTNSVQAGVQKEKLSFAAHGKPYFLKFPTLSQSPMLGLLYHSLHLFKWPSKINVITLYKNSTIWPTRSKHLIGSIHIILQFYCYVTCEVLKEWSKIWSHIFPNVQTSHQVLTF